MRGDDFVVPLIFATLFLCEVRIEFEKDTSCTYLKESTPRLCQIEGQISIKPLPAYAKIMHDPDLFLTESQLRKTIIS